MDIFKMECDTSALLEDAIAIKELSEDASSLPQSKDDTYLLHAINVLAENQVYLVKRVIKELLSGKTVDVNQYGAQENGIPNGETGRFNIADKSGSGFNSDACLRG